MEHLNSVQLNYIKGLRTRGRNRTASDEQRERNYRDESGKYQLSDGLQPWHYRLSDFMLANPAAKLVDAAAAFGVTPQWIGHLIKTDAFVEFHQPRLAQHQGQIEGAITSKLQGVAVKALDKLDHGLNSSQVDLEDAGKVAALALKSLGFGVKAASVQVNDNRIQTVSVAPEHIQRARQRIEQQLAGNTKELEHEPKHYEHVTASLQLGSNGEVEDAMLVEDDESDA
jgi:hypothetical protein